MITKLDRDANLSRQMKSERGSHLITILILSFLPLLFFWRLITPFWPDHMQIKVGDFTEQYFPLRAFTAQEWVQGRIPLWNPYLYGGQPALADIQSGALYPPHISEALILGWGGPLLGREIGFPVWALAGQVIIHFSIAAVGTYLFARHLGRQSGASPRRARFMGVIASLTFTYGGYLTGFPVQQLTILEVSAWLPWVLWGISVSHEAVRYHAKRSGITRSGQVSGDPQSAIRNPQSVLRPAAWSALAFALAILAGHPQTVLYIFYLSLAYACFLSALAWQQSKYSSFTTRSDHSLFTIFQPLFAWLFVICLGALIAAAQILPTLEFIGLSLRADFSYQTVSAGLPLNELISILYPGFFGGSPEYVGIASLVLIAAALTLGWPRQPSGKALISSSPHILFWAGAGLVALLLAFGGNTFLYPLFYLLAPGFEAVRQQERAFLVYSFSAAILAGYGALLLSGPLPKPLRQVYLQFQGHLRKVGSIAFVLTAIFIYGSTAATARGDEVNLFFGVLRHHIFGLIIFVGLFIWLSLRPKRWLRRTWGMGLLALWVAFNLFTVNWQFNLEKPTGTGPFTPNGLVQFLQAHLPREASHAKRPNLPRDRIVSGGLLPGGNSAASVYDLPDLTGNTPLQLAAVDTFLQRLPAWRMWQLMNVRYVIDERDISGPGLSLVFAEGALKVFEMGDPLPRAWFVSQTEVIADDEQALARLASDAFDLRKTALVASPVDISPAEAGTSTFDLITLTPTTLLAEVETSSPQLLVISQVYYPGWQATVAGQPVEVRRVNVIQQGLVVPAGKHTVQLFFYPNSFWGGSLLSIVGLVLWVLLFLGTKKAR